MESAHGTGIPSEQLIGVVRGVRNRYRTKRALRGAAITVAASWAILAASAYCDERVALATAWCSALVDRSLLSISRSQSGL